MCPKGNLLFQVYLEILSTLILFKKAFHIVGRVNHIFSDFQEVQGVKLKESDILKKLETYNFNAYTKSSSTILLRSRSSCWQRWNTYLLPILKTYHIGSSSFPEDYFHWKTYVLRYIVRNRIGSLNDVDFQQMMVEICPGQTIYSIKKFLTSIKAEKKRRNKGLDKQELLLHKIAKDTLRSKNFQPLTDNCQKKIDRIREVVYCYDNLITEKRNNNSNSI